MKKFKKMKLEDWTIKRDDKNRSGIDWNDLRRKEKNLQREAAQKHGATPEYGRALQRIKVKKFDLLRSFDESV